MIKSFPRASRAAYRRAFWAIFIPRIILCRKLEASVEGAGEGFWAFFGHFDPLYKQPNPAPRPSCREKIIQDNQHPQIGGCAVVQAHTSVYLRTYPNAHIFTRPHTPTRTPNALDFYCKLVPINASLHAFARRIYPNKHAFTRMFTRALDMCTWIHTHAYMRACTHVRQT